MPLEADEGIADARDAPQFLCRVADTPVFEFEQVRQLGLILLPHPLLHTLREHEIEEGGELGIEPVENRG